MSNSRNESASSELFYPAVTGAGVGAGLGFCGGVATFIYLATHPEHNVGLFLSTLPLVAGWIPSAAIGASIGATLFGAKRLCSPERQVDIENESQPLMHTSRAHARDDKSCIEFKV